MEHWSKNLFLEAMLVTNVMHRPIASGTPFLVAADMPQAESAVVDREVSTGPAKLTALQVPTTILVECEGQPLRQATPSQLRWRLWRSIPFGDVYPLIVRHCHGSLWRSIPFGDVYPLTLIVVVSVVGPKSRCWWRIGANGLTCSFQPRYSSGIAAPVSTYI